MRYIEWVGIVLMINLTVTLVALTGIFPYSTVDLKSTESVINGEIQNTNTSLAYKIKFAETETYLNAGVQDTTQQYMQAGGDFIRGLNMFYERFIKGTVLFSRTLRNFGVPNDIVWYFDIPLYFLYGLALIEFVSGRKVQPD